MPLLRYTDCIADGARILSHSVFELPEISRKLNPIRSGKYAFRMFALLGSFSRVMTQEEAEHAIRKESAEFIMEYPLITPEIKSFLPLDIINKIV